MKRLPRKQRNKYSFVKLTSLCTNLIGLVVTFFRFIIQLGFNFGTMYQYQYLFKKSKTTERAKLRMSVDSTDVEISHFNPGILPQ